jgi:amino acid adenylation domain-containing protein
LKINVLEYLEDTAAKLPDKIALTDAEESLTFKQLLDRAKSMGTHIHMALKGEGGRPIIVFVNRNTRSIVSFFGVLYSGNYYVPVDDQTPEARINAIASILNPAVYIETSVKSESRARGGKDSFSIDIDYEKAVKQEADYQLLQEVRSTFIDTDPAYIMFTSGSTGIPKGVAVSHRGIIDLAEWLGDTFNFSENDIIGNQTPFYFDASVKDIYTCVRNAATMHIIPRNLFAMPIKLIEYLNENKINTILWATSAIRLLANLGTFKEVRPKYLKKIFFAGENMQGKQFNIWKNAIPGGEFYNLYGPTEITVDCTWFKADREFSDDESIPIGRACRNMEILLLDERGKHAEEGEVGEIYVRGTGVALGYYNNKAQTERAFIQNPTHNNYPETVYKSGDLARYNEHGELVFVSRSDNQIKHLGNRIELGEIETAVNALPGIDAAVCLYDGLKEKIVLIYQGKDLSKADIVIGIRHKIPKYMIPTVFHARHQMPETANGKIDRKRLEREYLRGENS